MSGWQHRIGRQRDVEVPLTFGHIQSDLVSPSGPVLGAFAVATNAERMTTPFRHSKKDPIDGLNEDSKR